MMHNKYQTLCVSLLALCVLSACSNKTKETLGIVTPAPDEFMVLSHPPLDVPPDFNLRAPVDATSNYNRTQVQKRAKNALFDEKKSSSEAGGRTGAENALLKRAGVDKVDGSVRSELIREEQTEREAKQKQNLLSKVQTKLSGTGGQEPIVDPDAEQKRLKDNLDTGKSVTEGDTPTLGDPKNQSVFERWFN